MYGHLKFALSNSNSKSAPVCVGAHNIMARWANAAVLGGGRTEK